MERRFPNIMKIQNARAEISDVQRIEALEAVVDGTSLISLV